MKITPFKGGIGGIEYQQPDIGGAQKKLVYEEASETKQMAAWVKYSPQSVWDA